MPKDYLVCTLPCLGYFDTSYYCAVLSDQLSQYKPIPRPNFAPESSYNEPTIAGLLGHKAHSMTSRYLHSADAVLLAAADDDPGRSGSGGTG
jgi:hypothetical protein